jgi:hypothetical protein
MYKINFPAPRPAYDITTGAGRLMHLADVLDKVPVDRFALDTWVMRPAFEGHTYTPHSWNVAHDVSSENREEGECGFAGCAVGWACTVPEFNALGLGIGVDGSTNWGSSTPVPSLDGSINWDAVEKFFNLTSAGAQQLFDITHWAGPGVSPEEADDADIHFHPTPAEVAARIRAVVDWNVKNNPGPKQAAAPLWRLPQWVGVDE